MFLKKRNARRSAAPFHLRAQSFLEVDGIPLTRRAGVTNELPEAPSPADEAPLEPPEAARALSEPDEVNDVSAAALFSFCDFRKDAASSPAPAPAPELMVLPIYKRDAHMPHEREFSQPLI